MKTRQKRWISILLAVSLLLLLAFGIWFNRQVREQRLDHALIAAIKKRDTPTVLALLNDGADANATDRPYKPLTLNSFFTDCENRLRGNQPATDTKNYPPALMHVYGRVIFFEPHVIRVICGPVNLDIPDELSRANRDDPAPLIAALLDHGAHLDKKRREGELLLEYASECGDSKTVKVLLNHHVNPNGVGLGGAYPPRYPPLIYAHNDECARLLLVAGADANARGSGGSTRLLRVLDFEDERLREQLLEHGADPNAQDEKGITALIHLVDFDLYLGNDFLRKGIQTLIQHGAKVSIKDKSGQTALDYARNARTKGWNLNGFSWDRYDQEVIQPLEETLKREQREKEQQK